MGSITPIDPGTRKDEALSEMTRDILERIANRTLDLPAVPASVVRCMALLRENDFSLRQAAQAIEREPLLAARVLAVSNSATFGGLAPVRNVMQAATRLGADNLRVVLFEVMASHVFVSVDPEIRQACIGLWQHSRVVAATSRQLSYMVDAGDAGDAYVAGLLHDIGKPILASLLVKAENRLLGTRTDVWPGPETWMAIVQAGHRAVGAALAQKWSLPEAVIEAVANCTTYDDAPCSIVNCVRLANALAKDAGVYVGPIDESELADVMLTGRATLGLSDEDLDGLRGQLADASTHDPAPMSAVAKYTESR
jgi:putative nucleotidyltransferase with HDIG domain